jgi:hypothetical protein
MVYLGRVLRLPALRKGSLTMEAAQKYPVTAGRSSGRTGPPEFGGLESRWTPEDDQRTPGYAMTEQDEQQFVICARLRELGYARKRHVRLYGEEFHLISDPIPEGDGFAVEGIARRSGKSRLIRIPLSIVHTLRQELALDTQPDIAA